MKIGIDIDGVIIDFERTMHTYAELYDLLILKKNGALNNDFNYLNKYNWTKEEKNKFIDDYLVYATNYKTPFIPLSKEMLEIFKLENYEYVFITARGSLKKETKDAIISLFKTNNIDINNIYWQVNDKADLCKKLSIDLMIDDNPNICKQLQKNKIKTLYFRDKNSEKIMEDKYLTEVSNIGEICRYLINITGYKNKISEYKKILKNH